MKDTNEILNGLRKLAKQHNKLTEPVIALEKMLADLVDFVNSSGSTIQLYFPTIFIYETDLKLVEDKYYLLNFLIYTNEIIKFFVEGRRTRLKLFKEITGITDKRKLNAIISVIESKDISKELDLVYYEYLIFCSEYLKICDASKYGYIEWLLRIRSTYSAQLNYLLYALEWIKWPNY